MASNQRGKKNNNPEGRNQYSGFTGMMRKNPITSAAAAAAGAAVAGIFLWSKRDKISEQAGKMGDKISDHAGKVSDKLNEWTDDMMSTDSPSKSSRSGRRASPTGTEKPSAPELVAANGSSNVNRATATK